MIQKKDNVELLEVCCQSDIEVFDDEKRMMYADSCCHLNRHGINLLTEFIAHQISSILESASDAKASICE